MIANDFSDILLRLLAYDFVILAKSHRRGALTTPPRFSLRLPYICGLLRCLATAPGKKSGLGLMGLIALSLGTLGCATYHPHPISPSQTIQDFEGRRLDDVGLKEFITDNLHHEVSHWPRKYWDMNSLVLAAFYFHPDLDVARAKWGVTKAGVVTAGQHPNPSVGIRPQYVSNADIGTLPWLMGFTFDIPIETARKRNYRISGAKHQSEAARLNIETVAWQVRSRLRTSLLDFSAAEKSVEVLGKQLKLQEENLKLLGARSSDNLLSPFVLSEARLQMNQTSLSMREAEKQVAEARVRVADALGLPVRALDGMDLAPGFFDHPTERLPTDEVRAAALLGRPDILEALALYAAAESALRLEIAKQNPDINIAPGYEFDQGKNKWGFGFSITLPLFNRNKGPIAEAEAKRSELEASFLALQAKIIGEIDQAQASYSAALKKLKVADALLSEQKNKLRLVQESAGQGEMRRRSLLQAELEYDSIALQRLNALVDAQKSLGLLEDAVQHPLLSSERLSISPEEAPRSKDKSR